MDNLRLVSAANVARALSYPALVDALAAALQQPYRNPPRVVHPIGELWDIDARLLCMMAWREDRYLGIKLVTRLPHNPDAGRPALNGVYVLFSGEHGQPLAVMDGGELTAWRTAATSMLALKLMRPSAPRRVLLVGGGRLAGCYARAYRAVFGVTRIEIWARRRAQAEAVAAELAPGGITATVVDDLEAAAGRAESISMLTAATEPVLRGAWCGAGCHVDLVGSYQPTMREVDAALLRRGRICVDTRAGVLEEAGDIIIPLREGAIDESDIGCELGDLAAGGAPPAADARHDLTVFKSVGLALADLAAAVVVYRAITAP